MTAKSQGLLLYVLQSLDDAVGWELELKMGNTVLEMTKRLTEGMNKKYKGKMKEGRLMNVHAVEWQITLRLEKLIC